jgi:hypothetical protein
MKKSQRAKIEQRLASSESELYEMLSLILPRVVCSGEMLFFNAENLPETVEPHWLPPESETVLAMANSCVALRQSIGESVEGSIGKLFLSACHEAADVSNSHHRGPRRLAERLLDQISALSGIRQARVDVES